MIYLDNNATTRPSPGVVAAMHDALGGMVELVSGAGGETRTLALPRRPGLVLVLVHKTDGGGAIAVTVASAINQAGNTIITVQDAGDLVVLVSVRVGAALSWRVMTNDGAVLS